MKSLLLSLLIFSSFSVSAQERERVRECEYTCSTRCMNILDRLKDRVSKIEQVCAGEERLRCRKTSYGFAPFKDSTQFGSSLSDLDSCKKAVNSLNSGMICLKTSYGVAVHKVEDKVQLGSSFKDIDACTTATRNIRYSMICLRTSYGYAPHSINTGAQDGSSVNSLENCLDLL